MSVTGRVRSDRRCGAEFPLDDGEPSECDGGSEVNFTYLLIYNIYNISTSRTTAAPTGVTAGRARTTASARRAWTTGPPRTGCGTGWGSGAGTGGGWIPRYNIYTRVYYLLYAGAGRSTPSPTTRARPSATRTARTSAAASGATAGATASTAAARSASTTGTTSCPYYNVKLS